MKIDTYYVIGVMSGTSLDGIDICYVKFEIDEQWRFEIIYSETKSYSDNWINKLVSISENSNTQLKSIDSSYTAYLGKKIAEFIKENKIKKIDAICSHGHTVFHQPEKRLTYQIGNLPILASVLNTKVVCDFRVQDVVLGGQGAPLVPIGDLLLFPTYDYCLNLGGFSNISFRKKGNQIAYDICPVNIVLNYFSRQIGHEFDNKGKLASSGKLNGSLLTDLNNLDFYKLEYPKSLGIEWVNKVVLPLMDSYNLSILDIIRTFVEHIAIQIAKQIKSSATVLVTGGGTYNLFLIERIRVYSNGIFIMPSNEIIDFKEALVFGFLGVLKLRNENNCLKSVTGAQSDHSSGKIFDPH